MSKAEIERFVADMKTNPDLLAEVRQSGGGLQSVVDLAKSNGYDVSLDEAKAYVQGEAGKTLSDDQLDAVAGGKGQPDITQANASLQAVVVLT